MSTSTSTHMPSDTVYQGLRVAMALEERCDEGRTFRRNCHCKIAGRECVTYEISYPRTSIDLATYRKSAIIATPVTLCKEWQSGSNIPKIN